MVWDWMCLGWKVGKGWVGEGGGFTREGSIVEVYTGWQQVAFTMPRYEIRCDGSSVKSEAVEPCNDCDHDDES